MMRHCDPINRGLYGLYGKHRLRRHARVFRGKPVIYQATAVHPPQNRPLGSDQDAIAAEAFMYCTDFKAYNEFTKPRTQHTILISIRLHFCILIPGMMDFEFEA